MGNNTAEKIDGKERAANKSSPSIKEKKEGRGLMLGKNGSRVASLLDFFDVCGIISGKIAFFRRKPAESAPTKRSAGEG